MFSLEPSIFKVASSGSVPSARKLLQSEYERITVGGKVSKCCSNGAAHTSFMQARFYELMNPPDFMKVVLGVEC